MKTGGQISIAQLDGADSVAVRLSDLPPAFLNFSLLTAGPMPVLRFTWTASKTRVSHGLN